MPPKCTGTPFQPGLSCSIRVSQDAEDGNEIIGDGSATVSEELSGMRAFHVMCVCV